jgi:hypothetical protein
VILDALRRLYATAAIESVNYLRVMRLSSTLLRYEITPQSN